MRRIHISPALVCGLLAAGVWASFTTGMSGLAHAQSPLFPNTRLLQYSPYGYGPNGPYSEGYGRLTLRPPPPPYIPPVTPVYSGYGRGYGAAYGNYWDTSYGYGSSPYIRRYGGAGSNQPLPSRFHAPY